MACSITGALLFIETQKCNEGTNKIKYHLDLGAKEACENRTTEETRGLVQRDLKGATNDFFIFDV